MKLRYISIFATLLVAIPAAAQIDPTVEVTNEYERSLSVTKPTIEMAVPDSLLRFDLDFDYSVFENPYKGGYDFSPYLMDMKPEADNFTGDKFYLRAGAGYSMHPVFDFAATPVSGGKFLLNLYARHRSYFGNYRNYNSFEKDAENYSGKWSGHDADSRIGAAGRLDWKKGTLHFDVSGFSLNTDSRWSQDDFLGGEARIGVRSNDAVSSKFYYSADALIRYGNEKYSPAEGGNVSYGYSDFGLGGTVGPILGNGHRLLVGFGVLSSNFGGDADVNVTVVSATPRYVYEKGAVSLSLGARLGTIISDGNDDEHGQIIYPDIHFSYEAIKDHLSLFAQATGGERINSFYEMKKGRHFFDAGWYANPAWYNAKVNTFEEYNFAGGVRGNVDGRFRFDVSAGYARLDNGLLDCNYIVKFDPASARPVEAPAVVYGDYGQFYAEAKAVLDTRSVLLDGHVRFTHADAYDNDVMGFAEAPFSGTVRARYDWNDRIFFGVSGDFASVREGWVFSSKADAAKGEIPGYFDLGVEAEYAFTRKMSFWVHGGNLLGMTITRNPFCPEKSIYVTGGITIHL